MRLQIFAKEPVTGQVKTRLAPSLPPGGATAVYRYLVSRTAALAAAARQAGLVGTVELWCSPSTRVPFLATLGAAHGFDLRDQSGGDLGERMRRALGRSLAAGEPALLIGTDCPELTIGVIAEAARALADNDAVFVPAADGGYVLVGLARGADCFSPIAWSSAEVMAQTRALLVANGVRWRELTTLADIDSVEDLAAWLRVDLDAARELEAALGPLVRAVGPAPVLASNSEDGAGAR